MTNYVTKICHKGPHFAFRVGKANVYLGNKEEANSRSDWALMVSCAGDAATFTPSCPLKANKAAAALLPPNLLSWEPPPFLAIDWPDGSTPNLGAKWWETFVIELAKLEGDVVFYCYGGHGRTGTAAAIISELAGLTPKKGDPVNWLRSIYCEKAVESNSQLDYFEHVTGRTTKAVASNVYRSYGQQGSGYGQYNLPTSAAAKSETGTGSGSAANQVPVKYSSKTRADIKAELLDDEQLLVGWDGEGVYYVMESGDAVKFEEDDRVLAELRAKYGHYEDAEDAEYEEDGVDPASEIPAKPRVPVGTTGGDGQP